MNSKNPVFIEGTACLFKTTSLVALKDDFKVSLSEFSVDVDLYPHYRAKTSSLEYTIYKFIQYFMMSSTFNIMDRTPLSNWFYSLIFENLKSPINLNEIGENLPEIFVEFCKKLNVLVVISPEGEENIVLDRMINRSNGIDILSIDYVRSQNQIFSYFATLFEWPVIVVKTENNIEEIVAYLRNMCQQQMILQIQSSTEPNQVSFNFLLNNLLFKYLILIF